jgi:hypothetical protein
LPVLPHEENEVQEGLAISTKAMMLESDSTGIQT